MYCNYEYEGLKTVVIKEFNQEMKNRGSNLRFVKSETISNIQDYKLIIVEEFLDTKYAPRPNLTKEGEDFIRNFIESRGVSFMFSNTVFIII